MDVWLEVRNKTDSQCADCVKAWYMDVDTGVFLLDEIVNKSECRRECIESVIRTLESRGLLTIIDGYRCLHCGEDVDPTDIDDDRICSHCQAKLGDGDEGIEKYSRYKIEKQRKRDVEWVITIHGMNTAGAWQEEFSWRLAMMYGYSIPVSIFKYGNIKVAALLYYRRASRVRKFAEEIRRRSKDYQRGKPDVIAHSYGTLLLSELLKSKEYSDIELGRVVLTGSIIRPDYDWKEVLDRGQVEAILCHYSDKDNVVRLAQFSIPGTGPSGYCGFNQRDSVAHVRESTFGHSDYFLEEQQKHVMKGIWEPFLTRGDVMSELRRSDSKAGIWLPSSWRILTHAMKIIILVAIGVVLFALLPVAIWKGWCNAVQWILSLIGSVSF